MGLDGFVDFISKKHPDLFQRVHLSKFAYKKIMFDVSSYIYKFMATQGKERNKWLNAFVQLICLFRTYSVHVIFVFDGKAPPEKDEERQDRRDQRDESEEKCFQLSLDLTHYRHVLNTDPGHIDQARTSLMVNTMNRLVLKEFKEGQSKKDKRLLPSKGKTIIHTNDEPPQFDEDIKLDLDVLQAYHAKRKLTNFEITSEDKTLLMTLFDNFNIPYIQADDEAEATCNDMVNRGLADATFSVDSDCIAYRIPFWIKDMDHVTGICQVLYFDKLCEALEFEPEEVTMFAILCGTDYNRKTRNIKGVGPVGAYNLVKEYGTLDAIEEAGKLPRKDPNNIDHGLRYEQCVKLFSLTYPHITSVDCWDLNTDIDKVIDFLVENKLQCNRERLKKLWVPRAIQWDD